MSYDVVVNDEKGRQVLLIAQIAIGIVLGFLILANLRVTLRFIGYVAAGLAGIAVLTGTISAATVYWREISYALSIISGSAFLIAGGAVGTLTFTTLCNKLFKSLPPISQTNFLFYVMFYGVFTTLIFSLLGEIPIVGLYYDRLIIWSNDIGYPDFLQLAVTSPALVWPIIPAIALRLYERRRSGSSKDSTAQ